MITTPSLARAAVTLLALANHKVAGTSSVHSQHHHDFNKLGHRVKSQSILKSDVTEYAKMTKVDGDEVLLYWNVNEDVLDVRVVYKGLAWLGFGVSSQKSKETVIIGKPEKAKENQVRKYWLKRNKWSEAKRMEKKSQTLEAPSLVQHGSTTTLKFKKRLEEDNEIAIKKRGDNEFFVVVGSENRYHKIKKTHVFSLDLSTEDEASKASSDAKAEASKATVDDKAETHVPVQADEEKKQEETHKQKGSKKEGVIFVTVGLCIGAMALLSLLVGMAFTNRQTKRSEAAEQFPLMDDMDEVTDLS